MKLVSILLLSLCIVGCSTHQKSRLAATGIGIGAGAIVGSATAPSDERPELHAMYWGGIIGVATAIAANYYFNDGHELETVRIENQKLQNQIDFLQNSSVVLKDDVRPADPKYFPGGKARYKLKKVNIWKEESPYKRYHVDQELDIIAIDKNK